jgi:hypothetical protein
MRWTQPAALLTALCVLAPAEPARAVLVRYLFTADVALMNYGNADLLPVGTTVSGSFLVETDVPVPPVSPPRIDGGITKAAYGFDLDVTFEAPGFAFGPTGDPAVFGTIVNVYDDHVCTIEQVNQNLCFPDRTVPTDELRLGYVDGLHDPAREIEVEFSVRITDEATDPTMIEGLGIPEVAPSSPTAVGSGVVWMYDPSEDSRFELENLVFRTEVPEPGRALLASGALVALGLVRRSRR